MPTVSPLGIYLNEEHLSNVKSQILQVFAQSPARDNHKLQTTGRSLKSFKGSHKIWHGHEMEYFVVNKYNVNLCLLLQKRSTTRSTEFQQNYCVHAIQSDVHQDVKTALFSFNFLISYAHEIVGYYAYFT